MLGFFGSRLRSERGSVESLIVVASLFAALAFTGAQIVPVTLRMQDRSEVDQAFTLATPHTVRAGALDSTGSITLLDQSSVKESLVRYLQTFRTNVLAERDAKEFCAVAVDLGSGAESGCTSNSSTEAAICPRPVFSAGQGMALGWRFDGGECSILIGGGVGATILNAAMNDRAEFGSWSRYYFVTTKVNSNSNTPDPAHFQAREIDMKPQPLEVSMVTWQPSQNTGITMNVSPFSH